MASRRRVADSSESEGEPIRAPSKAVDPIYLNRPLDHPQLATKLKSLQTELDLLRPHLETALENISTTASDFADATPESDAEVDTDNPLPDSKEIAQLDAAFRSTLDQLASVAIRVKILSALRQTVLQNEETEFSNFVERYHQDIKAPLAELKKMTPRQKYLESDDYSTFRSTIWESLYGNDIPVPNIKKFLPPVVGEDEESDDDIEMGAQQADFKCPLTLTLLKDPVTSKNCPHSYSKDSIYSYIRTYKHAAESTPPPPGSAPCPIPGCPALVSKESLKENPGLKKRAEAWARREKEEIEAGRAKKGTQYMAVVDSDEESE